MRIGLPRFLGIAAIAGLAGGAGFAGCDNTEAGRLNTDTSPPTLLRILVQDATSYTIIDALDSLPPRECAESNPCPAGLPGLAPVCMIAGGETTGSCESPTAVKNPMAIGDPGSISVRFIVSKLLDDSTIEDTAIPDGGGVNDRIFSLKDPSVIQLLGPDGKEVAWSAKYYDNTGSPYDTGDPIVEPLGPALVIDLVDPLLVSSTYTLKFVGTSILDHQKQPVVDSLLGPIPAAGYTFKTDSFHVVSTAPDILGKDAAPLAPNDVLQIVTNADADLQLLKVTVTSSKGPFNVLAWFDRGADPAMCVRAQRLIDIYPVDALGAPVNWAAGSYTIAVTDKDAGSGKTTLDKFEAAFTVAGTPGNPASDGAAVDNYVLPSQCQ